MDAGNAGDGGYPVSFDVNWHGGLHLTAPFEGNVPAPVRAIADGTVIFTRRPTPQNNDRNHPLNYRGGWTDDGCVVIRHETDIGINPATRQMTSVVFFSIYMHLREVLDTVRQSQPIFRKDALGTAGRIYGNDNRIHFEIICDDTNAERLTGRRTEFLSIGQDGRSDAVYGAMWFLLLTTTPFHASEPQPGRPLPPVVFTNDEAFFVSLTFRGGDAVLQTHHLDGRPLGAEVVAPNYEYDLYTKATRLYPNSPSSGYELLRFGRVLGPDALNPPDAPHWREIAHPGGTGWVNLNQTTVKKFSDADFPHWDNWWVLVDGSSSADSRCRELRIVELLDIDRNLIVSPQEAQRSLNDPDVQRRLSRKICKFQTEWDATTVDRRFAWLKSEPRTKLSETEFARFKAHVSALCFWQQAQLGIDGIHWRFHPKQFVRHFKKCGWLSEREFAQCIPRRNFFLRGTNFRTQQVANWNTAFGRSRSWIAHINVATRKYLISSTPQRLAHFFAQILEESTYCSEVREGGGEHRDYTPYYGRGLIQLTHQEKYSVYGQYRRFADPHPPPPFQGLGWNPDALIATDNQHFNPANCADSAGFYWTCPTITANRRNGLAVSDAGIALADIVAASRLTNGNVAIQNINGLELRIENFIYLKYILLDFLRNRQTEQVQFDWRRNSAKEPLFHRDGTPVLDDHGRQKRGFISTRHVIDVPLDHQRP